MYNMIYLMYCFDLTSDCSICIFVMQHSYKYIIKYEANTEGVTLSESLHENEDVF